MAKARTKQKTSPNIYEKKIEQLRDIFPRVKVTKWSDRYPGKSGKDFIMDIILPKNYTLISKSISSSGEITSIVFSVQKKHCTENQKPGLYRFSA